jgi:gas vesicle protein GvpA/GvpJ/GvpM family
VPLRVDPLGTQRSTGLVDVLDRVLDKGLVIAGDVKISLAEVELITIRIRLIVCSMDKAQEMGLDWWKHDPHLAPGKHAAAAENEALRKQVRTLERRIASLSSGAAAAPAARRRAARGLRTAR